MASVRSGQSIAEGKRAMKTEFYLNVIGPDIAGRIWSLGLEVAFTRENVQIGK
jgi:hypothetical protein